MQCSEPEMRHILQVTLCNKASHFSIIKKNTKLVNMNVLNFNLGLKVCLIHHFQMTGSKFVTNEVIRQVARYDMAV